MPAPTTPPTSAPPGASGPPLSALFLGGTGTISSACVAQAQADGFDVTVLNRGNRELPAGVRSLVADINDREAVAAAVGDAEFDVVAQFLAFTPETVRADVDFWRDRCGQYLFISSASAYQTPPRRLPITESTPLSNPFWDYSRNKIACEEVLVAAYRADGFPVTIVRPSHTYDRRSIPLRGGWTVIERMRAGRPIVVHGDGSSLWTLTHHRDFARGFVGLMGNSGAIGEPVHITSDEALTWDRIANILGEAAGATPRIVHVTSDAIAAVDPEWGASLLGDKTHSMVFDNSKLKSLVPGFVAGIRYDQGAREAVAWFDADPPRRVIDPAHDARLDLLVEKYG